MSGKDNDGNGWSEYEKLVLFRFEKLEAGQQGINDRLTAMDKAREDGKAKIDTRFKELESSVTNLKIKAGIISGVTAIAVGSIGLAINVRSLFASLFAGK